MSEANVVNFPKRIQPPKFKLPPGLGAAPNDSLSQGARGALVASLQQWLYKRGFDPGDADGIYGARTAAAVGGLQQLINGIGGRSVPRTGNFDDATVMAVNMDLNSKSSVLRSREDDYLTQPPQRVTWGKVVASNDESPTEIVEDKTRLYVGLGLGAAALGLLGWMFLSDKKKGNAAIAGEDLFDSADDDLGDDRSEDDDDTEAEEDTATLTERSADFLRRAAETMTDRQAKRETIKQADWLQRRAEALRRGDPSPPDNPFLGLAGKTDDAYSRLRDRMSVESIYEMASDDEMNDELSKAKRREARKLAKLAWAEMGPEKQAEMKEKIEKRIHELEPQVKAMRKARGLDDAPTSSPKGKMQACASQWRALGPDKGDTNYRAFMSDCMKSFA